MANTLKVKLEGTSVLTQSVLNGIDVSNVIAASVNVKTGSPYTATQDCIVIADTARAAWNLNGVAIFSGSSLTLKPIVPLKKGQTFVSSSSNDTYITVYGIKR